MPYRTITYVRSNGDTRLYQVAGSERDPLNARNALKEAVKCHGGDCFYCLKPVTSTDMTVDHADAKARHGSKHLQNLLIACRACNQDKGLKPIEFFNPRAGREWLSAVLEQVELRLKRTSDGQG